MGKIRDLLCEMGYEDAVVFENPDYENAVIGVSHDGRVIYSLKKMIDCLTDKDNMTYEEALEFIDYNVVRAIPYAGKMAQ